MATKTVYSHDRQGSAGSASIPFPLPASPTLTNPDMILPDYERADSPEDLPEARLTTWRNTSSSNLGFHLPLHNGFPAGPVTPTTPIIYGNGTMLSDIGEVTEVESNAGLPIKRSSSRYSQFSDDVRDLQTPPAVAKVLAARRGQPAARRASIDSTSTITTHDNGGNFTDFDDLVSIDDDFQGDDEQSMASSYVDDGARPAQQTGGGLQVAESNSDRYSTSLISKKAEEILANAKRRLTTMEDNLTRARSSLGSPILSDGSTPSPPILQPAPASRISGSATGTKHSRNLSDISFQDRRGGASQPKRSASALGVAGGYRQPVLSPKGTDVFKSSQSTPTYGISHHPLDTALESPGEDALDVALAMDDNHDGSRLSVQSVMSEYGMVRSSSAAQVRDLQDQMNGLRGKISSLREQARADSLKRRSLQSLRTPSPFTHARWDQGYMEPRDIKSPSADNTAFPAAANAEKPEEADASRAKPADAAGITPAHDAAVPLASPTESQELETSTRVNGIDPAGPSATLKSTGNTGPNDDSDDLRTENGDAADGEEANHTGGQVEAADIFDDGSESGESFYHEAYQAPISHEDREDAFDYEHFFLHSAMGTISQGRFGPRGGPGSVTSDDSVETTRAITPNKRASLETISSVETFATADEGRASRSSEYKAQTKAVSRRASLQNTSGDSGADEGKPSTPPEGLRSRGGSILRRTVVDETSRSMHRPSVASFESTGTTRSFPLVSPRSKSRASAWSPGGSPDGELRQISDALIKETLTHCDVDGPVVGQQTPPLELLGREDRIFVERLVASLGKCVMALGEASRASSEARTYRRRLDAARRVLDGLDE